MKHLIFDTETTGLIGNSAIKLEQQPHLIEFCGIVIDESGKIFDELEFFANPGIDIPEEVTRITGLKSADVSNAAPFSENAIRVGTIIQSADVVVAHNLSYDHAVVNYEFRRCSMSIVWPKRLVCTVEATEHMKGYRLNLTALHELLFGTGFPSAHRARNDVEALARCYVELMKRGEF